ncbi:hypothetical protein FACS189456_5650 [Bacteroidia bacterium]|nr:hypothetical protein FACS189456_5650 [Bacteroidia bacterium]
MDTILTYLSANYPLIAVILAAIITTAIVVWWASNFYIRMVRTESEVISIQTDLKNVATKAELKEEIAKLKANDFLHTNKAILLLASGLLYDKPDRFERIKDCILETTPDNKKDEINAITL